MWAGGVVVALYLFAKDQRRHGDTAQFRSCRLVSKEPVSSTISLFAFLPRVPPRPSVALNPSFNRAILSIEVKQPLLQISRRYTPLPYRVIEERQAGHQRVLIRREEHGEVSGYLHGLPVNTPSKDSFVEIRGPFVEYEIPEDVGEILFLAGGTGIAPAVQVASAVSDIDGPKPSLRVLWANRSREDCQVGIQGSNPAAVDFQRLQRLGGGPQKSRLALDYFVDDEGSYITKDVIKTHLNASQKPTAVETGDRKLILISGSDGFVNYFAGTPRRDDGTRAVEENPNGGILSQIDLAGWEVVKL